MNNDTEAVRSVKLIVGVAQTIRSDKHEIIVSSILPRNRKRTGKTIVENSYLEECAPQDIFILMTIPIFVIVQITLK